MTIAHIGTDNWTAGSGTTVTPTFPAASAGRPAGDLALLVVANKVETVTVTTPSGWTVPTNNTGTGGAGSAVADDGPLRCTVFWKLTDGTEIDTTSVTVNFSAAHSGAQAIIAVYSKTLATWEVKGCGSGSVSTAATAWSQAVAVDPGIGPNDWVGTVRAATSDVGAWTNPAPASVISGCTLGTLVQRANAGTTNGNDMESQYADEPINSGTSSSVATVKGTESSSLTGVVFAFVFREVAAAAARPPQLVSQYAGRW